MSVAGHHHRDSIGSTASLAIYQRHIDASTAKYTSKLDGSIQNLARVRLEAGRTRGSHEGASEVARRLGEDKHVFALLEKCFIESPTTEKGIERFAAEMKIKLTTAWKGYYPGKEKQLDEKIDKVIHHLVTHAGSSATKIERRANGFKEAAGAIREKGVVVVANEHRQIFDAGLKGLEDRVLNLIKDRSQGRSLETSKLVAALYQGYGEEFLQSGGPLVKLHDAFCKSQMRAANPREIQFMMVRNLASRLAEEKGYSSEDANRKAYHITQKLYELSKTEIADHLDHITGYLEAADVSPDYVKQQIALHPKPELATILSAPAADKALQQARLREAKGNLQLATRVDSRLSTALQNIPKGTSSSAIADKLDSFLLREMIRSSLASTGDIEGGYDRSRLLNDLSAGFYARFISNEDSVLRRLIPQGEKSLDSKLAKVGEAILASIDQRFSDDELKILLKERQALNGLPAELAALGAPERQQIVRYGLERAVESRKSYEAAWQLFEEKVDQHMTRKKGTNSYKSSEDTIKDIFADPESQDIGERLVRGYYETSDKKSSNSFQMECFHRFQGILARKDEDYYFRNAQEPEKGKTKPQDLFKEMMKKLGVSDPKTLDTESCGLGKKGSLSDFERFRQEAIRSDLAPWLLSRVSSEIIEEALDHFQAVEAPRVPMTSDPAAREFNASVWADYGAEREARFVRAGSTVSSLTGTGEEDDFEAEDHVSVADERRSVHTVKIDATSDRHVEGLANQTLSKAAEDRPGSERHSATLRRGSVGGSRPGSQRSASPDSVASEVVKEEVTVKAAVIRPAAPPPPPLSAPVGKPGASTGRPVAPPPPPPVAESSVAPQPPIPNDGPSNPDAKALNTPFPPPPPPPVGKPSIPPPPLGQPGAPEGQTVAPTTVPRMGLASGLADTIKAGTTLKTVSKEDTTPPKPVDPRNAMLAGIKDGVVKLKSAQERKSTEPKVSSQVEQTGGGLLGLMASEMSKRRFNMGEVENDSDSDSDSGWSDDEDDKSVN